MNRYHRLLSEAVGQQGASSGMMRKVIYERARWAMMNHFKTCDPPLGETETERQRLALEEAIQSVEDETTKRQVEQAAAMSFVDRAQNDQKSVRLSQPSVGLHTAEGVVAYPL